MNTKPVAPFMVCRRTITACASATLLLATLFSCSPKVVTSVTNTSYTNPTSEVRVYDEGAIVPNTAQVIGTVRVGEGGLTPTKRCRYPIVLDLAKQETAKAGGNALFVRSHQYPDIKSSCHRITCDMLHLTDTIVDPTRPNPLMEEAAREEKAYFDKLDKDNEVRKLPLNYIGLASGYIWLSNEIWTDRGKVDAKTHGIDFALEYSHLWQLKTRARPLYAGFSLIGLLSLVDCEDHKNYYIDNQMTNYFVGADFKMAYKTSKRFVWHVAAGFGYAHSEDDMHTSKSGGLGVHSQMGIDYIIGKHFGIGLSMNALQTYYPKPAGWPSDKRYGIDHSSANFRIGYYF